MKARLTKIILLLAVSGCVYANPSPEEIAQITNIVNSYNYVNQHPDVVWPGFKIGALASTMIYFNAFQEDNLPMPVYAINFAPKSSAWQPITIAGQTIYYLPNDTYGLPGIETKDFFSKLYAIDGQKIIVEPDLSKFFDAQFNAVGSVAMQYSQYLMTKGLFTANLMKDNSYNDIHKNILEDIKLAQLEYQALNVYLQQHSEPALQDAVAIQQVRDTFAAGTANFLTVQGLQGTALYVGISGLNLDHQAASNYLSTLLTKYYNPLNVSSDDDQHDQANSAIFTFNNTAMGNNTVFAHALDDKQLSTQWKAALEKQSQTPTQFIESYYHFTLADAQQRVAAAKNNALYAYQKNALKLDILLLAYTNKAMQANTQYQAQQGIKVQLNNTADGYTVYEYFSNLPNSYTLASNQSLTVQPNSQRMMLTTETSDDFMTYEFKLSPTTTMNIDGKTDTLAHYTSIPSVVPFQSARLKDGDIALDITPPNGEAWNVVVKNGMLSFTHVVPEDIRPAATNAFAKLAGFAKKRK